MEEIQPTPRKKIKPTKTVKAKCWEREPDVSEFVVLGWEDGSVRFMVAGPNGPLNRNAVLGAAVPEGASDAQIEAACRAAMNPR